MSIEKFKWDRPTRTETMSDVVYAVKTLDNKAEAIEKAWDYYYGEHDLVFSTQRLQEIFGKSNVSFVQNWCSVVVDSIVDRLVLESFSVQSEEEEEEEVLTELNDFWDRKNMLREFNDIILAMVATGEAYLIGDIEGEEKKAFYNYPEATHVFYDAQDPGMKEFACKQWFENNQRHIMLYYSDRFEHYIGSKERGSTPVLLEDSESNGPNPWNPVIPVWHFTMSRRNPRPDYANAISIQDSVNKMFSDMMVASEYAALPWRWAITAADFSEAPVELEEDGNVTETVKTGGGIGPVRVLQLPPAMEGEQPVEVGEWGQLDIEPFISGLDSLALSFSSITRTPKHYFTATTGDPSGESLQAQEAPLIRKVRRYINNMIQEWQEFGAWVLDDRLSLQELTPVFSDVRTVQTLSEAQARRDNKAAGISIITQLRDAGWREPDIEQLLDDRIREAVLEEQVSPEVAALRMENATDKLAEDMEPLAKHAMEVVRDSVLEAFLKALPEIERRADNVQD